MKVFRSYDRAEIRSFFAMDGSFYGGVFVAGGDINGDSYADIIVGAGAGGGPRLQVFDGRYNGSVIQNFFAFDSAFGGGISVGATKKKRTGATHVLVGAGAGGGASVRVLSFDTGSPVDVRPVFQGYASFQGQVWVAGYSYKKAPTPTATATATSGKIGRAHV